MNWTYAGCAFKNNPLGMFAPANPDVSCKGYDFSLQEKPGFLSLAGALTYESICLMAASHWRCVPRGDEGSFRDRAESFESLLHVGA